MSHANAALTPKHRLRMARAIVDEGWTAAVAAKMFQVSPPTARKWALRYRIGSKALRGCRTDQAGLGRVHTARHRR